jgi:nucleotide-binding universal stress UspA family protein
MFKKILVPLDGSELSEQALTYAEELAGTHNSEINLIYVCESGEAEYRHMYQLYIEKTAEQVRNHVKSYHPEEVGLLVPSRAVVLDGDPASEIINYADRNYISLICMVSHGRSGIVPWSMGSTTFRVIQRTTKPVLLIRASISNLILGKGEIFNKILVPLDGSEDGEAALPYVKELTSRITSEVILYQVVAPGKHVHTIGGLDYVPFPETELEHLVTEARQYLENTGKKLTDTKATISYEVKTGDAAQSIIEFADEINARLVAISTHGRSGIRRWISGSVAYKILQASNTPVLLARAPEVNS